ncbi:nucleotidyltransferase domain-containing protein [Actinoplanes sp. NPDC048988]|uniref:nucleotidyltransferase domain-containing protein n=1 Tax=Actinoplanes sp. NPDC048988 TaxID=3363901 RepID=UPI00371377F7
MAQPWNSSPLSSDGPDLDKGFREFVALAEESGAKLYAYGSRLLGKEGPGSDWDVLIEGLSDPFRLVAQVVQQIPAARYRTDGELASLFTLPRQNVPISATDLVSILRDGLPYFYIRDFPVDLMKAGPAQVPVIPDLEREDIDIVGTIVGDAVDAYSMPRRLSLALGSGEIVSVFFLTWFLQGLGRRIGQKVTFQALRRDRQGKLWFASRFSKITLL